MALSKRLRFEVLRRDDYRCRYCGATSEHVLLTVDHVLPVALGGKDDATNLVAACADCNSGKSSATPSDALVADVEDDALRYMRAAGLVAERRVQRLDALYDAIQQFDLAWTREVPEILDDRTNDWDTTVATWLGRGLTLDELVFYVPRALLRKQRWRYFCWIAWRLCDEIDVETRAEYERGEQ